MCVSPTPAGQMREIRSHFVQKAICPDCFPSESDLCPGVELTFVTHGIRVRLKATEARILEEVEDYLPPLRELWAGEAVDRFYELMTGPGEGAHELWVDGRWVGRNRDWKQLFHHLETDLQLFLGVQVPDRVFVHAGVVAWNGLGIVIPGRSFSGKSTLVLALLRQGATYFSDEFAVLDDQGLVYPYPRHLSLRSPDGSVRLRPDNLEAPVASGPVAVDLVLLTRFRPGTEWAPRSVTHGEAILELVQHCLPIRYKPGPVLDTLSATLEKTIVLEGDRGEADETARHVLGYLQKHPPYRPFADQCGGVT